MFGFKVRSHGPVGGIVPAGQTGMPGSDIGPALIPVPAVAAQAWQSRGQVHGAPGTQRIPAPAPMPGYDKAPARLANVGNIGLGGSAVPYWYPQLWYQTDIPATIAVQTINQSHEMPVPAIRPNAVQVVRATNSPGGISPGDGSFAARIGGKWPIGWPKVISNYPESAGLGFDRYGP